MRFSDRSNISQILGKGEDLSLLTDGTYAPAAHDPAGSKRHDPLRHRFSIQLRPTRAALAALCFCAGAALSSAQDLEPKAYTPSPIGAAFLVAGYSRSSGGVLTDPTLPLSDVNAKINGIPLAFGYTFPVFGKTALVLGAFPVAWANVKGQVFEQAREVTRSGFTDARFKLSVNLVGNPAMGARAFAKAPRKTIVGASLAVSAPTGQYEGTKLINLGTNRWAFKPEVGVAMPKGRWDVDAYLGVWLFTHNANFFPGGVDRWQSRVVALQGHVSYTLKPRMWAALDATWYEGGVAQTPTGTPSPRMNNSRLGATFSLPVGKWQSFKVAYSGGLSVRTGTNFRSLSIGWQWLRLTRM